MLHRKQTPEFWKHYFNEFDQIVEDIEKVERRKDKEREEKRRLGKKNKKKQMIDEEEDVLEDRKKKVKKIEEIDVNDKENEDVDMGDQVTWKPLGRKFGNNLFNKLRAGNKQYKSPMIYYPPKKDRIFLLRKERKKIFSGDTFFFVKNKELMCIKPRSDKVIEYGGTVVDLISKATHIITGSSYLRLVYFLEDRDPEKDYLDIHRIINDRNIMKPDWISHCIRHQRNLNSMKFSIERQRIRSREEYHKTCQEIHEKEKQEKSNTQRKKKYAYYRKYFGNENRKNNFFCGKDELPEGSERWKCKNQDFINELQKLADKYNSIGEQWRCYTYRNAIGFLKNYPKRIKTFEDARELTKIKRIGSGVCEKIEQLLEFGRIIKLEFLEKDPQAVFISDVMKIHGIGHKTAYQFWDKGYRKFEEVMECDELNRTQRIGKKYFDDFFYKDFQDGGKLKERRIPRDEVQEIGGIVRKCALEINPSLEVVVCGSYRRGAKTCGDVDVLISEINPGEPMIKQIGLLRKIIERLRKDGFLLDCLNESMEKNEKHESDMYMGVCKVPGKDWARRLDIKVYARDSWPYALLYFTGCQRYNRSMRQYVKKYRGNQYTLSDKELKLCIRDFRNKKESKHERVLGLKTEREVLEYLSLPWKEPNERNDQDVF